MDREQESDDLHLLGSDQAKIYSGLPLPKRGGQSWPALIYYINPSIDPDVFRHNTINQFYADASNGTLPAYAFIEPQISGYDSAITPDDQHLPRDIRYAENLINQVYRALRNSPQWERAMLIVTYDEHGGFFDHRLPPAATPPDSKQGEDGFAFYLYGIRVPAVLISPFSPAGNLSPEGAER